MIRLKRTKTNEAVKYSKSQIIAANKYKHCSDIVNVILKEEALYTLKEVDNLINQFMKGKVN